MTSPLGDQLAVPVAGGMLRVGCWHPGGPVVLAVHGITATQAAWVAVAREAPDVTLLAPDLRGRGRSADLPAPYGFAAHVADLVAVLDARGCDEVVVAGHSMGGFLAVALAARHPERVARVVLVDGGLPLDRPDDPPPAGGIDGLLGPAADRLRMTFPTREAYREFWRAHPGVAGTWGPAVEAYVDHDLAGDPPRLHSSCRPDAMRADGAEVHDGARTAAELRRVRTAIVFLRAERGLLDDPAPLYPPDVLDHWLREVPGIHATTIVGTNHYSILLGTPGGRAVATALRAAVAAP
ncbi:MAG TPA: alpha/beta hydrolase [Mycobacteriales bacterium]|nr:alpha/beta hydrolase [Mycobacteriales bacterium]